MEIWYEDMDIDSWLAEFKNGWKSKDVGSVLSLFTEDVEYYETPFEKLEDKKELRREWEKIKDQRNIDIRTEVFAREENRFAVKWRLSYTEDGKQKELEGVYLIRLNQDNQCEEFWQYFMQ